MTGEPKTAGDPIDNAIDDLTAICGVGHPAIEALRDALDALPAPVPPAVERGVVDTVGIATQIADNARASLEAKGIVSGGYSEESRRATIDVLAEIIAEHAGRVCPECGGLDCPQHGLDRDVALWQRLSSLCVEGDIIDPTALQIALADEGLTIVPVAALVRHTSPPAVEPEGSDEKPAATTFQEADHGNR